MTPTILFEGRDLLVRANTGASDGPLVVTFTSLTSTPEDRAEGFAEAPLNKMGINNLVFISSWNHGWQTDEMPQAIAAAREHIRALAPARVSGYGSSVDSALQSTATKYILFDSKKIDGTHVALMQGNALQKRPLPFCGHNVGVFLKFTEQLKPLLEALVAGNLDEALPVILQESRRRRGDYPKYQHAVLDRVEASRAHKRLAKRLVRSFVKRNPEDPVMRERLAGYLLREGNPDGARRHAEFALRHGTNRARVRALLTRIDKKAAAE